MTARQIHTVATLAAELLAELPTLTEQASQTLARTLLSAVDAIGPEDAETWRTLPLSASVATVDRNRVLAKAGKLYL